MQPLIGLNTARCIQCKACMAVCPNGCHRIENGEHRFIRETCVACGKCVDSCPVQALEMIGKRMTADEVMRVVRKDQKYYGTDGGMTLSGGEAAIAEGICPGTDAALPGGGNSRSAGDQWRSR